MRYPSPLKTHRHGRVAATALLLAMTVSLAAGERDHRLVEAVRSQQSAAVMALLAEKVDVDSSQTDGATALHWAAFLDNVEMVQALLGAGANVNALNDLGVTPLWLACNGGSADTVEQLLRAGADANHSLPWGETPLMAAARTGNVRAVKLLSAHGADVNAREGFRGQTALMWAIAEHHAYAVAALIELGADVQARTATWTQLVSSGGNHISAGDYEMEQGGTPPLLFAARVGDLPAARLLVAAGVDVSHANAAGITALMMAIQSGHPTVAAWLIEQGADPNADAAQYTALHAAVLRGDLQSARALLARGADPNAPLERGTPVRRHSKDFSLHYHDVGATPFWLAAKYRDADLMRALATAGADLLFSKDGLTPLLVTLERDRHPRQSESNPDDLLLDPEEANRRTLEAVKAALDLGADVHAADPAGNTALHRAAAKGLPDVIALLVAKGGTVDQRNARGQTPLVVALAAAERPGGGGAAASKAAELLRTLGANE